MRTLSVLLLSFLSASLPAAETAPAVGANVHPRGSLTNSRLRFEKDKVGHVAFMGGSITEMNGYRPMVCEFLTKRFPHTKFTFTNAGIASTCSTTGAFRLADDVLAKGPVDLFFVEFAVNDDQDAHHARRECIRGMEGIIRHVRAHNPNADIVVTHFANEAMLAAIDKGGTPLSAGAHEEVAAHYGVPTIGLVYEAAARFKAGTMTWKEYGGVHPGKPGNALCASMIEQLLSAAWKEPLPAGAAATPHPMPDKPLDAGHYGSGRFLDSANAVLAGGWKTEVPDWKSIKGSWRDRFRGIPLTMATEPGAELTLEFEGAAVGAYLLAGPDAGMVEASVDGGAPAKIDVYHAYSGGLHYPRTVMFAVDLPAGKHTLKLRVAADHNPKSAGTAIRIVRFVAN